MKSFFLYLYLFPLFTNAFIKPYKIKQYVTQMHYHDYETVWDAGEVEWEFQPKDTYFTGLLDYNNHINSLYDSISTMQSSEKIVEKNKVSLNENIIVNTIVFDAILSGLGQALYNEYIRIESIVLEMNDLLYDNYSGNNVNNDITILFFSLLLSIHYYSKNTNNTYNKIDNMKEYLKIRRTTAIMFFIFLTIMTKNIQHVD
jgi:hypothetical protein